MSQKSGGEAGTKSGAKSPWHDLEAPGIAAFEDLARDAFARLPASFRALCEGLVIRIEDFPTDEVLDEMDAETPFDLLGLFQGIGRAQADAVAHTGQMPNMVFLYRRPILDYWAENEETLGDVVTHVLVHEIGHHFGLSDDDMEAIEDRAN
ncbi:metallopeptidase family protein [Xanthobacter autotrophicus]|uniref:metallopeptidase family protein n=1 Tax=Xanthobacter autotrophicus TaxID=280 RepID=UPI0024A762E2|nr:metallopeptidase family protein [Xanthobacter autotrophicus]MDI4659018.1 metallopeptidase family protein [Xanthobacter autotrophicus]